MGTKVSIEKIDLATTQIPLLPIRDTVIFPHTVTPLAIGRKSSIKAINYAVNNNKYIFLVSQKDEKIENPNKDNLYQIGTFCSIIKILKFTDNNNIKALVEGIKRAKIKEIIEDDGFTKVIISELKLDIEDSIEVKAMKQLALESFKQYTKLSKKIPEEILDILQKISDLEHFSDVIIANLDLEVKDKQELLEINNIKSRLDKTIITIQNKLNILNAEKKIRSRIHKQMEFNQRDYYLNEKIKSIQKELGNINDDNDIEELKASINKAKMPTEVRKKVENELKKLQRMSQQSSDASIVRTYIENLCKTPWKKKTIINKDIKKAQSILNEDHYGLSKIKERILEYLAVQTRVPNNKANILCFIGPPGVGKTSLGKSIARAVNRKYIRMSLGGIRDEAEIRGHRRTYIGAMPGTIIQKMQKAQVTNPLFLFDEIDKMSYSYQGDPSSAMLEVLDPEQNHTFNDHYIEVDYDLSQVMFIVTANSPDLPPALLDRMEVVELSGYTEDEKLQIAKKHLIAKAMQNNGVKQHELSFDNDGILDIIRYYSREAGVRNLERSISTICRKIIKECVLNKKQEKTIINKDNLEKYLGVKKFRFGLAEKYNQIGEVTGLAWTPVGGDLLTVEAVIYKGKGKLNYTGQLGDVMKESIQTAMSVVRSRCKKLNIDEDFYKKLDIHIHVPDGSTPKDGPSAGATMCVALVSVLTKRKVRADIAMTGEITLRGEITPIGGLKEKMLAALRGGIKNVIIPNDNDREFAEIPDNIKNKLNIIKVKWIDEILNIVFEETANEKTVKQTTSKIQAIYN